MNIYIDCDDVITETARALCVIARELFGIDVPYEDFHFFDLRKTFGITEAQYDELMIKAHTPESLLSYEETRGAADTINSWIDAGHDVKIITGRPATAYEATRRWLDDHGLTRPKLYCVDKYGRDNFVKDAEYSINLEEFYKMHFDFAVEDSPLAFKHLLHLPNCRVAVFDRPWNRTAELPNANYTRCSTWSEVDKLQKNA